MSDENTARHAECTVEFDGVDITSSIKPYLLSLTFTDNEEDASDDLQIKLQDREGVWMTDWLQKMLTAMCRPHLLMATRLVTWCSSLAVHTTRHLPTKRQTEHQRLARPRSPSSSRARCTRTMLFTRTISIHALREEGDETQTSSTLPPWKKVVT